MPAINPGIVENVNDQRPVHQGTQQTENKMAQGRKQEEEGRFRTLRDHQ